MWDVYQSPGTSKYLPQNFNNYLVNVNNTKKKVIILADINAIFIEIAAKS